MVHFPPLCSNGFTAYITARSPSVCAEEFWCSCVEEFLHLCAEEFLSVVMSGGGKPPFSLAISTTPLITSNSRPSHQLVGEQHVKQKCRSRATVLCCVRRHRRHTPHEISHHLLWDMFIKIYSTGVSNKRYTLQRGVGTACGRREEVSAHLRSQAPPNLLTPCGESSQYKMKGT